MLGLAGCAVQTYYAPENPTPENVQPQVELERAINVGYDQAWGNLEQFVQNRYQVLQANKANGVLRLTVQSSQPEMFINCGMVQVNQGFFNTDTEFLAEVMKRMPVNLGVNMTVKLQRLHASKTRISVNGNYALTLGYGNNLSTGVASGSSIFKFNSKTSSDVYVPGQNFSGVCQSTGQAESALINAAGQ